MAATSVSGWLLRVLAIALGLACLAALTVGTLGGAIILLAVLAIAHAVRRRAGKPLTLLQSWLTAAAIAAILTAGSFAWLLSQHDKTGQTRWHTMMAGFERARNQPTPPPPGFLRYLPGGNVRPAPLPKAANGPVLVFSLLVGCEFIGMILGSLIWGAAWIIVSGWTGRLAGAQVTPLTDWAP